MVVEVAAAESDGRQPALCVFLGAAEQEEGQGGEVEDEEEGDFSWPWSGQSSLIASGGGVKSSGHTVWLVYVASVRSALDRLAPVRSACHNAAPLRLAPVRSASRRPASHPQNVSKLVFQISHHPSLCSDKRRIKRSFLTWCLPIINFP